MLRHNFKLHSPSNCIGFVDYESTGKAFSGIRYIVESYTDNILWKEEFIGNFKNTGEMLAECQTKIIKVAYEDL